VKTTGDAGTGKERLTLDEGAVYTLCVQSPDRFEHTITAEGPVKVSGEGDATKLRSFSDSDTLKVGREAVIRLHSRLETGPALVTFQGKNIIDYRIIHLIESFNPIPLKVAHRHFPNFRVAA